MQFAEAKSKEAIVIKDVEFETFLLIIEFIYTGRLTATMEVDLLYKLFAAAGRFQVTTLHNYLSVCLQRSLYDPDLSEPGAVEQWLQRLVQPCA